MRFEIIEVNVEIPVSFIALRSSLSVAFDVEQNKILENTKYWCLENSTGYLGVELMRGERPFQTFAMVNEDPALKRNVIPVGQMLAKELSCKVTLPHPNDGAERDRDPSKLLIFNPYGRRFVGYGDQPEGDFEITSISEVKYCEK
ncbi:hypothetical protein [Labrenzia sp. DG1229]|uniref:hypothetical protein n=1 Tax=Labrenzia sp. DG1229 TaxID=681847 RepID=UPI00049080BC|nr:hypothetical protein [Labrenzia sp. DG1229]